MFSAGSIAAEGVFPVTVPCAELAARFNFHVPLVFLAVSPAQLRLPHADGIVFRSNLPALILRVSSTVARLQFFRL
jgi:hypothetical protein